MGNFSLVGRGGRLISICGRQLPYVVAQDLGGLPAVVWKTTIVVEDTGSPELNELAARLAVRFNKVSIE